MPHSVKQGYKQSVAEGNKREQNTEKITFKQK